MSVPRLKDTIVFGNTPLNAALKRWENKTGLRAVPYSRVHLLLMRHDKFQQVYFDDIPNYADLVAIAARSGPSFTILNKGRVLYSAGIYLRHLGCAEAWMLSDTSLPRFKIAVCQGAKSFFDLVGPALGAHRAQIIVNLENSTAVNWAKWLKFQSEGVLKEYGSDKSDHLMMSRIY